MFSLSSCFWLLLLQLLPAHGIRPQSLMKRRRTDSKAEAGDTQQKQDYYETERYQRKSFRQKTTRTVRRLLSLDPFELMSSMDAFKTESSIWTQHNSETEQRPTLTSFHYLILPSWWDDGDSQRIGASIDEINAMMERVSNYYKQMSWNKHTITWDVLEQVVLTGISRIEPGCEDTEEFTRQYIETTLGLVEFVDYSGIIVMYEAADSGPLGDGGRARVNDNFVHLSFPGWFDVTRHEIGHNYGHPHHLVNAYDWRLQRGEDEFRYDGWDMMSGGNEFAVSDFAAASKWHFNWVTDDAVVLMRPEGPSNACPNCVSAVQGLVLVPFDDPGVPPSSFNKMAVHIPLFALGDQLFSYWLSYRGDGGNGFSAGGLSVHVTDFTVGGLFGAEYDSLNFDAFGDTETTSDSFVIPGTCYMLAPPSALLDVTLAAAEQAQPIVCIDDMTLGKDITVSVSFRDMNSPPNLEITPESLLELGCSVSGASSNDVDVTVAPDTAHMIHYNGTGFGGSINLSLCVKSGDPSQVKAYFYDTYPYPYLALGSPAAYGAFRSIVANTACPTLSTIDYRSEYGETFVLILSESDTLADITVTVSTNCTISQCLPNQHLVGAMCAACPAGFVAEPGSDCVSCEADGLETPHPGSHTCVLANSIENVISANEWRLLTQEHFTTEGWVWDLIEVDFFSDEACNAEIDTLGASAFDSGVPCVDGYSSDNAFDDNLDTLWGGRPDSRKFFFVGLTFPSAVSVKCARLNQKMPKGATKVYFQARQGGGNWKNVWIAGDLKADNTIPFSQTPTKSPIQVSTSPPTTASVQHPTSDAHVARSPVVWVLSALYFLATIVVALA